MGREPLAAARWMGCCPRVSTARAFALYSGERSLRAAERRDLEAQKWRGVYHMGMFVSQPVAESGQRRWGGRDYLSAVSCDTKLK